MRKEHRLLSDMRSVGMWINPMSTALVLGYEIGLVYRLVIRSLANRQSVDRRNAYRADLLKELADAVMQLRMLSFLYGGPDLLSLAERGEEQLYERMQEIQQGLIPRPAPEPGAGEYVAIAHLLRGEVDGDDV